MQAGSGVRSGLQFEEHIGNMSESRLHINTSIGLFEVSGSEEFIRAMYDDAKESGLFRSAAPPASITDSEIEVDDKPDRPKRASTKRSGPGCGTRIGDLKADGFFADLRDPKAIGAALAAKGHNYEGKHIAAALLNLTKNGTLRRVKKDGNWMYQQP
jgi:hypothetical protein